MAFRFLLAGVFLLSVCQTHAQQDVDFHLKAHLLSGKKILKVKRDFYDPYVWVLAQKNEVYRVNSQTQVIDNYTAKFSAYDGLQFTDIAGHSANTVFIATNSTTVIQLENGVIKTIGNQQGIAWKVNSIGLTCFGYPTALKNLYLLISTDSVMYRYDINTRKLVSFFDGFNKIYEASYKRTMYADSSFSMAGGLKGDNVNFLPAHATSSSILYSGFLRESDNLYGYHVKTAYYLPYLIYEDNNDREEFLDYFWGNSRGMFQVNANDSGNPDFPYRKYLDGIPVNKISSVFGLTSFGYGHPYGESGLIRETLLAGTDKGLYFSSSTYNKYENDTRLRDFSLFHYDEIGNIVVNDISVNTASISEPICEDGVWLATNDGLYLIKPDYAKYINAQNIKAAMFENQPANVDKIDLCDGSSINALIDNHAYSGATIQWYRNGAAISGEDKNTLTIKESGGYYALLYDPCENTHLESNHLTVNMLTVPVFSFTYPDKIWSCENFSVTLKTDDKPGYKYRWYTNGQLNNATGSSIDIVQPGKYKVEVSTCTDSWVPSKEVEVGFSDLPQPNLTASKTSYCLGDEATLNLDISPNAAYDINWYRDNQLLSENKNKASLVTDKAGSYSVTVTGNQIANDGDVCSKTSTSQNISFHPLPVVSIEKIVKTTLCQGETVKLKANYNTGTVKWSTGETTDQIDITQSGTYEATVISASGCIAKESINVDFFPLPELNVADAAICTYKQQPVTLTAPAGFSKYTWNNQTGGQTYVATKPQTVSLTVMDADGCKATKLINVVEQCPDIHIPNTFTPNDDGINDTWKIEGIENDVTAAIKVYTRYGALIYQSLGGYTPWDGKENGKKLPAGVYYYVIIAKHKSQKFSGSITIIY